MNYLTETMTIAQRIIHIKNQITLLAEHYARPAHSIQLIAVTKGQSVAAIEQAIAAGQTVFAENYWQEAQVKLPQLQQYNLEWHYIGVIQSNKTKPIAEHFAWVHTVSSLKIAQRLSAQRPAHLAPLNVCIQVNIDNAHPGVPVTQLFELATSIVKLPHLQLRGLMTLPANDSVAQARQVFKQLAAAYVTLQQQGIKLDTLSMGMSNDFPAAIAEGATYLRVGTAIFGTRG